MLVAFAALPPGTPSFAASARALDPNGLAQHEAQGYKLVAATGESVTAGGACPARAPVRSYDVVALNVDITVNRFGDHDPRGMMYALASDVARVRDEERRNAQARGGHGAYAVTMGLQGDAIQPLTVRVDQGECLRITLRNDLARGWASIHIHGAAERVAGTTLPAIATQRRAYAPVHGSVSYEWWVSPSEPEGTHYFHSHGDDRAQTSHGLFGAIVVEPAGSTWLDPLTGAPLRSGWSAMIHDRAGHDFREYAIYYHEIGDETYQLMDANGNFVPLVDPYLLEYRPDGRALNYRSEPFMNRMKLQQSNGQRFDESLSYSSYAFGDPAVPIARAYLGDPVKQRIVHAGSEVFHIHHVHGGSIRWRRQPGEGDTGATLGLDKKPPLTPGPSERTDSQSIGPSETFDLVNECGAGGCQASAGDFLMHCHVAQHYFAGMWAIWRVYNTLQDGAHSTDGLPPLRELPDRAGKMRAAVTSDQLARARVSFYGASHTITDLHAWVETQLPPRGVARGYDASVWDWSVAGATYYGEPADARTWPGYTPTKPRARPPLLFDPASGKLAYPFMQPHLGKRPPFAPDHGPAPFLDPTPNGADPPAPGADGPASLCPSGTRVRTFDIHAIAVPVVINRAQDLVDPNGELYVLKDQEARALRDPSARVPLTLRADAQRDCVDVVFSSELADNDENRGFSKVNLHIHFVQFDVQSSDGVITGYNYEQSVRPFRDAGTTATVASAAGATSIMVARPATFARGAVIGIGMNAGARFEARRIARIAGSRIVFDRPLSFAHARGEWLSAEFIRSRWYPDAQFGTAYFHDHVNALHSWQHGLFGALIAEPPDATFRDPYSGAPVESGPIADVITRMPVSADVKGSFREVAIFLQDEQPITHIGESPGDAVNLRAEPVAARARSPGAFSSANGEPETPVVESYLGDPVVMRTLVGATNEVHTLHVDGHWFRAEPWSETSPPIDTIHVGISERYDLYIPRAGGPQGRPGDYLWYDGRTEPMQEGAWGVLRVLGARARLRPLPGRAIARAPSGSVCPAGAPSRSFDVATADAQIGGEGHPVYTLAGMAPGARPRPLVLHADVGDCIHVTFASPAAATLHADMLAFDPQDSYGVVVGRNRAQDYAHHAYTFYASPEVGPTVAMLRSFGDVTSDHARTLIGAIVVSERGAHVTDPATGADASARSAISVVVHPPGARAYRDDVLLLHDEDAGIGTHRMPYRKRADGAASIDYGSTPLVDRLASDTPWTLYDDGGSSPAPVLRAFAGDPMRLHVLAPWSEQAQVFSVEGNRWPVEPARAGSALVSSALIGGSDALTIDLAGGAGGAARLAGRYLYGDHREPFREAGMWGILDVRDPCAPAPGITLIAREMCGAHYPLALVLSIAFVMLLIVGVLVRRRVVRAR